MDKHVEAKKSWARRKLGRLQKSLVRQVNKFLALSHKGYVFYEGRWTLTKIRPKKTRHTYHDGVRAWDLSDAAPLPFDEPALLRLNSESRSLPVPKKKKRKSKLRARRYLKPELGIDGLVEGLEQAGYRHVFLRWFEDLPRVEEGEDVDLLVEDEVVDALGEWFLAKPVAGAIRFDIYSAGGLPGTDFRGLPYYEKRLAEQILDHTVLLRDRYRVPHPRTHFLSLAYHAVYHKAHKSGLPPGAGEDPGLAADLEHEYPSILARMAAEQGEECEISLKGLHGMLERHDWAAGIDTIRKLSPGRPLLLELIESPPRGEVPGELCVFVVRQWAWERDLVPWMTSNLRAYGFDVQLVHELDEAERAVAASRIRGGNWNRGPWPESGGPPYALIAAYDYVPEPPGIQLKSTQPFAVNARSVEMKSLLRDGINRHVAKDERVNAVHSADDEQEAWEYLNLVCPDEISGLQAAIRSGYQGDPYLKLAINRSNRSVSHVVFRNGRPCILRHYADSEAGRLSLEAERKAMKAFAEAAWAPRWEDFGPNWFVQEFLPQRDRLDERLVGLDHGSRLRIAVDLLSTLAEIHAAGYAHRDVHAGNVFLTDDGPRLIDFETLVEQDPGVPFRESYDVCGKGLPSPFVTGNMCLASDSSKSVLKVLGVEFDEAWAARGPGRGDQNSSGDDRGHLEHTREAK
ncbi:MAG: hypothetical protein ABGZ37_14800 [Akkermansiaceae bacterium]